MNSPTSRAESAPNLALAVIAASNTPLLLLDHDLKVIAASLSFSGAFELDPAAIAGQVLLDLGAGEWDVPQLRSLLRATASGFADIAAYEMDLVRRNHATCLLVLNARRLDYAGADADNVRILLSISDATAARSSEKLRDQLLKEKAVLLQELQHRVANSLQIIASVILQSAMRVKSADTREHLYAAHERILSVATVQKQLSVSTHGDVELRPYFTALCESLGASMIRDQKQMKLEVSVDDSAVDADVSVSLGLIVTELVINALKHAFPERSKGRIMVAYRSHGPNWTLTVSDDGIGMPTEPESAKAGLGTSIVEALTRQLNARIKVADLNPGTEVSIIHAHIAAVDGTATAQAHRAV